MTSLQHMLMSLGTGVEGEGTSGTYTTELEGGKLTVIFTNVSGDEVAKVEMSGFDQPTQVVDVQVAEWANT